MIFFLNFSYLYSDMQHSALIYFNENNNLFVSGEDMAVWINR